MAFELWAVSMNLDLHHTSRREAPDCRARGRNQAPCASGDSIHRALFSNRQVVGLSLLGPLSIDAYLPAFADIQRDFHASTADLQLTLTGYLLAFASMSLVHGPLSDAFGRRRIILSGLLAFGLAALGCALSPSVGWLTAFRVVQGMSAGVGTVVGTAVIRDCFESAAATKLLALVSMIFSLSPALAPVFGSCHFPNYLAYKFLRYMAHS